MHPSLTIAFKAARAAAHTLMRSADRVTYFHQLREHERHKALQSSCQQGIQLIAKAHENHPITCSMPDQAYAPRKAAPGVHWHIEVVHGGLNLMRALPCFWVSVCLFEQQRLQHCALINPVTQEEMSVSRGRGMQLNGQRVRAAQATSLSQAVIALSPHLYQPQWPAQQVRFSGCDVMDLGYVAAGRIDAALLDDITVHDRQIGALMAQESGCISGTLSGTPLTDQSSSIMLANPVLFKQLLKET